MNQQIPQDETRQIIISDMVKKRSTIVPIIGDDVLIYKGKKAEEVPFQEFLLQEFQKKYPHIEVSDTDLVSMRKRGYYGLSLMSQYYERRFLDDFMDFVNENRSCIKLKDEVLDFLVTFNFPIIITTVCFDIIEKQLKGKLEGYKSKWYSPNEKNDSRLHLGEVYHIFGQADDGKKWVYDEDMLLTFLIAHNSKDNSATGLIEYLKENEKKLFVLGCNLPNWLFRFLWQPTQNGRTSNMKTTQGYWINKEKPEDSFENFLKKKNFSADEQVKDILVDATKRLQEELKKEAEDRSAEIDAEDHFDVFISYASEDRQIATAIFGALKNMNVKAWFDDRGKGEITPGSPYWEKIRNGIKHSGHFMPIITGNWMAKMTSTSSLKEETLMVKDWLAECRKTDSTVQLKSNYSIPVIINGSEYNEVEITNTYIEQFGCMNVLPKSLFFHIDMISFDEKNVSVFEKIEW